MQIINLPPRFKDKLDIADKQFNAIIYEILNNFETLLNSSTLDFFPEYNNHGIIHLNNIFKIQDELITDASFKLLTVEDITTLIIATLAHDIGMHLNYEGFQNLIDKETPLGKKWYNKWIIFFQLAKKYNESKLKNLFGDIAPIEELPNKKQDFKTRDYMLVGEFLRINHPELAEDILKYGFPIADKKYKVLSKFLQEYSKLLEFSQLLAKSHGMNLRDTFDTIEKIGYKNNLIFSHNIHIVYLMVILRLSDYLDIYKNRNPKIILGLKSFISEISKFEWEKNTSVTDENPYHEDKEAIFLGVNPQNSIAFMNLQKLFQGIQYELDISWAVLGEIYSRADDLKELGIKYRRIRTNIDNEDEFNETVNYLPKKIAFEADGDLLKLLIAPLYGNDPSYGVRELLQNSVDACKERELLSDSNPYKPRIDVTILKEEKCLFEIKDNGLGMDADTIINYFLKAGASFRNSEIWREQFEDENQDSKVERTGRFGVGLLAAFLFGNKIEVQTRHYKSKFGFKFQTHLSDNQINIEKDGNLDIGTLIRVEMSEDIYNKLNPCYSYMYEYEDKKVEWQEWYKLNDIDIFYNGEKNSTILANNELYNIESDEYDLVQWFYIEDRKEICICNGFKIPEGKIKLKSSLDIPSSRQDRYSNWYNNTFNQPSFLITDKNGKLPLSLNREKFLVEEFSFNDAVIYSMADILFDFLVNLKIGKKDILHNLYLKHPIFYESTWKNRLLEYTITLEKKIIYSKKGFNLFSSFILENENINKLIFIELKSETYNDNIEELIDFIMQKGFSVLINHSCIESNSNGYSYLLKMIENKLIQLDRKFDIKGASVVVPKNRYKQIFTYSKPYLNQGFKDKLINSNQEMKRLKYTVPAFEESEYFSKNCFFQQIDSIFNLEDLDKYVEDIGLIAEIDINTVNTILSKDMEYYFENKLITHFKDKENSWVKYAKN